MLREAFGNSEKILPIFKDLLAQIKKSIDKESIHPENAVKTLKVSMGRESVRHTGKKHFGQNYKISLKKIQKEKTFFFYSLAYGRTKINIYPSFLDFAAYIIRTTN